MEEKIECRICKSKKLRTFLDLGNQPLANSFVKKEDLNKPESTYPLKVAFCEECHLSQLTHVVAPEILFRDYVYFSSGMPKLSNHFKEYAQEAHYRFVTSKDNLIVEIGSNDGILLNAMKEHGVRVLGVDPAINIAKVANERGIETIPEFFSEILAKKMVDKYGQANVIIGNNVVAHINDHHDLVKGVKILLEEDGVFIFEAPYLVDMFDNLTFDTVYHEHLSYLSIEPLTHLFNQYDMEIFDVKTFPVQGNSIRVYAARKGTRPVFDSVREFLNLEKSMKMDQYHSYVALAQRIAANKINLMTTLNNLKSQGKNLAAYGAPAKGNTLLNYFGINNKILDYATEGLPSKIGFYTPGTHIPVMDIETVRKNPPDYYLLLAWNYKDVIIKEKEINYLRNGGKFISPVGNLEII